jgi:hypothetical protein
VARTPLNGDRSYDYGNYAAAAASRSAAAMSLVETARCRPPSAGDLRGRHVEDLTKSRRRHR